MSRTSLWIAAFALCALLAALTVVATAPRGTELAALDAAEQQAQEEESFFGLGLERDSSMTYSPDVANDSADSADAPESDLPPFVNPTGVIQVPTNSNFTMLRNHSVAGGGTTGFWGFVTQVGTVPCTDMRAELTTGLNSCTDGLISFWGLTNVNIDGSSMTAQFLYQFSTGNATGETSLNFCYFRPWEGCQPSGNPQLLKVQIVNSDSAVNEETIFA